MNNKIQLVKAYLKLGNADTIGLVNNPLIHISNRTITIGSTNAFDISHIVDVLKTQSISFSIKTDINIDIYPDAGKIQRWVIINSIINLTIKSCQKD